MILDAILGPSRSLAADVFDDSWYDGRYDGFGGRQTSSGIRVDEHTAFNQSVCWAATRLLAGTTGWLPFNLHKRRQGGGADIDSKHHVHRLIHDQPNEEMGAMMFRCRGVGQQVNQGNCFAEIGRTAGGFADALYPIHSSRIPKHNIKRENGRLVYYVNRPDGGRPDKIPRENMFHVPSMMSDDGIYGKGVVTHARETIGKALGTQQSSASALRNGGAPPLALKNGKFKDKADREEYRRQLKEVHSGPKNAGEWLLLPPEAEVQMLGFSLKDSEFINSQQFDIEEIARWYGVPPHLVGHLLRATFNNIEELGISFVKYSLIQWLKLWEQEVWLKLLTKEEQQTHYAKFKVDALERGNMATRTEAGVKNFFNGHWTLNQWAEIDDMNPVTETTVIDGKEVNLGDVRFVQQAMIPLANAAKGPAQQNPTDGQGPAQQNPTDELRTRMDTYGVGVRAGAITPQTDDEDAFRQAAGLPPMSEDAKSAWKDDDGIRRPITLRDPNASPSPFGQHRPAPEAEDKDGDLSVLRNELETLRQQLAAVPHGLNGEAQELRDQLAAAKASQRQLAGAVLNDVMARMVSLEINGVKRVAEKASKFDVRLREFYDKHKLMMERALLGPLSATGLIIPNCNQEHTQRIVERHVSESLRQLDALTDCQADELSAKVAECVDKWHEERATVTL